MKDFIIHYWNHEHDRPGKPINDCFGNSLKWKGKARTIREAIRKARKANKGVFFRVGDIYVGGSCLFDAEIVLFKPQLDVLEKFYKIY